MAIARIFDGKGWAPEQYDALIDKMNLEGRSGPGVPFHWAAATPDGMRAVDVYESREAADRLVQERVGPAAAKLRLPLPEITEYEIHALLMP